MKLKFIVTTVLVACATLNANAQGMEFMPEGSLFKDAIATAQKENKMVFLDCYTSWCGPCKALAAKVFPTKEVGDYMNPRFVCIKIDMEKGEGPELNRKFEVSAYPTMIIFNKDGGEIGRMVGGGNVESFLSRVKEKSVDSGIASMDKRFDDGDRDPQFLMRYVETLGASYKRDRANDVAEAILQGKENTFAEDSLLASVFMKYITNPFCPAFIAVAKNPAPLMKTINKPLVVEAKMNQVWTNYPRSLVVEANGTVTMDEAKFQSYLSLLKECGKDAMCDHQRLTTLMTLAERQKNWSSYVGHLSEYLSNPNLDMSDLDLCKKATPITRECKDAALRATVKSLLDKRLDDLMSGRRQQQTQVGAMRISGNVDRILTMLSETLAKPWAPKPEKL